MKFLQLIILTFFTANNLIGQVLIRDINPGPGDGLSHFDAFEYVSTDDWIYFIANDGTSKEIWRTDGTTENTERVSNFGNAISIIVYPLTNNEAFFGAVFNNEFRFLRLAQPNAPNIIDIQSSTYSTDLIKYASSLIKFNGFLYFIGTSDLEEESKTGDLYSIDLSISSTPITITNITNNNLVWLLNGRNLPRKRGGNGLVESELILHDNILHFLSLESDEKIKINRYNPTGNVLDEIDPISGTDQPYGDVQDLYHYKMDSPPILYNPAGTNPIIYFTAKENANDPYINLYKYEIGSSGFELVIGPSGSEHLYPSRFIVFEDNLYFLGAVNNPMTPFGPKTIYKMDNSGAITDINISFHGPGSRDISSLRVVDDELIYYNNSCTFVNTNTPVPNLGYSEFETGLVKVNGTYLYWYLDLNTNKPQLLKNSYSPFLVNFDYRCDCFFSDIIRLHDELIFFASVSGVNEGLELYKISTSIVTSVENTQKNHANNLNIFPNPASDKVFISYEVNNELINIEVINSLGEVVLTKIQKDISIDISHLSSGCYFIKINSDNGSTIRKFIKN